MKTVGGFDTGRFGIRAKLIALFVLIKVVPLILLALLAWAIVDRNAWWLLAALFCGYGFAWVGHFFFEKNRPATFKHPLSSFVGDWVMFKDILTGKIPF